MHSENKTVRTEVFFTSLLNRAGITPNGTDSWDIQIHDKRFFPRLLAGGSIAMGESYMDGWWDVESLDEFFVRVFNILC